MNLKRLLIKWYFRYLSVLAKSYFSVSCRDVYLGRHVQIIGIKNVEIGKGSTLGDFFWLNVNHRDQRKRVRIGNYSNIGRNNFFTVGEELIIGDYFLSSCYCSIIGASHKNDDPFTPYVISGVTSGSSIKIGCNVFMGAHSMVIGGVNIGFGSIIGAGALVNKDIPPLSIVVGNPAKIIKRYSFRQKKWVDVDNLDEEDILDENEYLKLIKTKYQRIGPALHAASERIGWL